MILPQTKIWDFHDHCTIFVLPFGTTTLAGKNPGGGGGFQDFKVLRTRFEPGLIFLNSLTPICQEKIFFQNPKRPTNLRNGHHPLKITIMAGGGSV